MDELVRWSRDSIAKGSKSFAMAARLFDRRTRDRAWMLYAWCRHCDDVVDGQALGLGRLRPAADTAARVAELRRLTARALEGRPTGLPAFDALHRVAGETGMPDRYPFELIDGFAMDAEDRVFRTFEDTLDYCYHVAGVVGVMMAIAMGVEPDDEATLARAADLGIAFQLANIARDVMDDAALGRCYLPAEWLSAEDIPPGELVRPLYRAQLARVVERLVGEMERYEQSALYGTPALPWRAAWAVLAAAGIYGDIGREVRRRGGHAWDHRVHTSRAAKLGWMAWSLPLALSRKRRWRTPPAREGLWTRPSPPPAALSAAA